eukprot:5713036-Pyramimonas_sp.AAC.1
MPTNDNSLGPYCTVRLRCCIACVLASMVARRIVCSWVRSDVSVCCSRPRTSKSGSIAGRHPNS